MPGARTKWFTVYRGSSLPLIRQICDELGVSRNVVIAAYEQLAAEGTA